MDLHWPKIKVTTIPPALGTTGETLRVANRESSRAEAGGQGQVSHWGCWLTAHTHTPAIGCPLEIAKTPVSYQPGWRNAWQTAEEVFKAVSCPVSLTPAGRVAGMCLRALPQQHKDGSGCFVACQVSPTAFDLPIIAGSSRSKSLFWPTDHVPACSWGSGDPVPRSRVAASAVVPNVGLHLRFSFPLQPYF